MNTCDTTNRFASAPAVRRLRGVALLLCTLALVSPAAAQVVDKHFGGAGTGDGAFDQPFGVAEDPIGNIYVSDVGNHRVQKFDPDGNFIGWAGRCTGNLQPPPNDDCDVVNQRAKGFRCKATTCTGGGPGANPGQFDAPHGITVRFGRLYVADRQNNRIQILDLTTGIPVMPHIGSAGGGDGQFQFPFDVTADSVGNIYVADSGNDRVQKFSPSGTFLAKFGVHGTAPGQLTNPHGIAVDPSDAVYVADRGNDRIQKFSPSGTLLAVIGSPGSAEGELSAPVDVAVDSATGEIVVGELGNERIQLFDAAGTFKKAMGYGVQNGEAVFQVCTHDCQAGVSGTGFGQYNGTNQVAIGSIVSTNALGGGVVVVNPGGLPTAVCGNGTLESGELCDGGASATDCCAANCRFEASTVTCRTASGVCDNAETCTGTSAACPADSYKNFLTTCRASAGDCDVAETCSGIGPSCPGDSYRPSIYTCRVAAGDCDQAETCTGSSAACPTDAFKSTVTTCRASAGDCDVAELCTGASAACPADVLRPTTYTCRASAGDCDVAESCTGASATCPTDAFKSTVTTCRAAAGDCDVAESCTGASAACPADVLRPTTYQCRASAGDCDVAESCTGASAACPSDGLRPTSHQCRASAGDCDVAESCTGASAACPADVLRPTTYQCRASAGDCDVAESCTGASATCPSDGFQPAAHECRASAGDCDVAESCTGASATCPSDGFQPPAHECRASAGDCDVAETCTGSESACPADAFAPASHECRAAAGECDQVESCSGTEAACPTDEKRPEGAACSDDGNVCSRDFCDGAGDACTHPAGNAGAVCRDESPSDACDVAEVCSGDSLSCPDDSGPADADDDGVCDGKDACTNVGGGGIFLASSRPKAIFTSIGTDPTPGNDKLSLRGAFNLPAGTPFSAIDVVTNGARVIVRSAAGVTRFDTTLPGGAYAGAGTRGWKTTGSPARKYQYVDKSGAPLGGLTTFQVLDASARAPGQVKVIVGGSRGIYPVVAGDDPVELLVVLGGDAAASAGLCAETAFLEPECAYNAARNKLTCKQ